MRQRVDEEPRGRRPAALGADRVGIDATHPPVLLQQGQGRLQVGGFAEPAAGGLVGVAAAEVRLAGAADPVQQPAGIVDAGVGAHQVEHGSGVLDQVVGQPDGAGEDPCGDRSGPAVAQVAGQV